MLTTSIGDTETAGFVTKAFVPNILDDIGFLQQKFYKNNASDYSCNIDASLVPMNLVIKYVHVKNIISFSYILVHFIVH